MAHFPPSTEYVGKTRNWIENRKMKIFGVNKGVSLSTGTVIDPMNGNCDNCE